MTDTCGFGLSARNTFHSHIRFLPVSAFHRPISPSSIAEFQDICAEGSDKECARCTGKGIILAWLCKTDRLFVVLEVCSIIKGSGEAHEREHKLGARMLEAGTRHFHTAIAHL